MKYSSWILFSISLLLTACNLWDSSDQGIAKHEVYSPVPIENSIILETDSLLTVSQLIASLDEYQNAHINTLCVRALSFNSMQLHALVDTCHQAGINLILHSTIPDVVKTKWVTEYDVDGFHCTNVLSQSGNYWQKKIDSLDEVKQVIMICDNGTDESKDAGFTAGQDMNLTTALKHVFEKDGSISLIDTALTGEVYMFTKTFSAIRITPDNSLIDTIAEEARLLATYAMPGVLCVTASQLKHYGTFLQSYLTLYTNTPTLQYGDYELYDSGSKDVFTLLRTYQGKKILFAINTHNHPSSYNWPLNLMGITTELLLGEKITRNGGQELLPYGYQVLNFENIDGMNVLLLHDKSIQ